MALRTDSFAISEGKGGGSHRRVDSNRCIFWFRVRITPGVAVAAIAVNAHSRISIRSSERSHFERAQRRKNLPAPLGNRRGHTLRFQR